MTPSKLDARRRPEAPTNSALGEHWQSALCVTSLYDSYVALQHENDAVRDELAQLKLAHARLAAEPVRPEKPQDDDTAHEVKLLRAEKSQQALLFDKTRAQLELQVAELRDLCREQQLKLQARLELDPLEPQRVALSTKTLQDALEQVMREKEELLTQHRTLHDMHQALQQENRKTADLLQRQLQEAETRRASQASRRVRAVLDRWAFVKVSHAWQQWRLVVLRDRLETEKREGDAQKRAELDAQKQWRNEKRVAQCVLRALQSSTRRCFGAWQQLARARRERRLNAERFQRDQRLRRQRCVFAAWYQATQAQARMQDGASMLARMLRRRATRRAWREWMAVPLRVKVVQQAQEIAGLREELTRLQGTAEMAVRALATASRNRENLESQLRQASEAHATQIRDLQLRSELSADQIGSVLFRRLQRRTTREGFCAWALAVKQARATRHHVACFLRQPQRRLLAKALDQWREAASQQRRVQQLTRKAVQRMRLLGASRCFAAWREFAALRRERVVHYMKHQQLLKSIRAWRSYRDERKQLRQQLVAVGAIAGRLQRQLAFAAWRKASAALGVAAEQLTREQIEREWRLEQSQRELQQLRVHFLTWRSTVRHGKRFRQLAAACAVKWRNGAQGKCFDEWREGVAARRAARELLRRLASRRATAQLHASWSRWRTQTLLAARQLALREVARERDERVERLERALGELRTSEAAAQATRAEREQRRSDELRGAQRALEQTQRQREQLKRALAAVCSAMSQKRRWLHSVRAWQGAVRKARQRRRLVELAAVARQKRTLRSCFREWNRLRRQRKSVAAAVGRIQHVWGFQAAASCLGAWLAYAQRRRRAHTLARASHRSARDRLCRSVLVSWRWEARKAALLRRTLEQIWLSSVHAHLSECFSRWHELAQELRLKDELQRRQLALASLQTRICARWTTSSQRVMVAAWREGVASQQRARHGIERLRRLHDSRLRGVVLDAWRSLCGKTRAQREWLRAWQRAQAAKGVAGAWTQWTRAAAQLRREQVDALQAANRQHEQELETRQHEISALSLRSERLASQLESLQASRARAETSVGELHQRVELARRLFHWRAVSRESRRRRIQVDRMRVKRVHASQRRAFGAWRRAVESRRESEAAARGLSSSRSATRLRVVLRAWRAWSQRHHERQSRLNRLETRRQRRVRSRVVGEWRRLARRTSAADRLGAALHSVALKLAVAGALATWRHVTQRQRVSAEQQAARERTLLAFVLRRHAKYFRAWKACTLARLERARVASQLARRAHKRLVGERWRQWIGFVDFHQRQARSLQRLRRPVTSSTLRAGLHRWRAQAASAVLETLRASETALEERVRALEQHLAARDGELAALRGTVRELDDARRELQDAARTREAETARRTNERVRQLALAKLLTRCHTEPLASTWSASAFHQWRRHTARASEQLHALRRWSHLAARRQKAVAFWRWRRRVTASARLEKLTLRQHRLVCRETWQAWRGFVRLRSTRRRRLIVRWIEATHMLQVQAELEQKTAMAFRLWHAQAARAEMAKRARAASEAAQSDTQRRHSERRRRLLATWLWRAYHVRCKALRSAMSQWRATAQRLRSKISKQPSEATRLPSVGSALDDHVVVQTIAQGLETILRRLSAARSASELFDAVATGVSQATFGAASGVLYLLDPTSHELWTQRRDSQQTVQAPASLGLAGAALSAMATQLVVNAASDPRFHARVDQLSMGGVAASHAHTSVVSTPIIGLDGVAYGVVQIAWVAVLDGSLQKTQVQVLAHASACFVEQTVHEMVRHCRDRVRSRSPQQFARLFTQNKNWRKYFVQVEKEAQRTQRQLQQLVDEQDVVLDEKRRLQQLMERLDHERRELEQDQDAARQRGHDEATLMRHLVAYKKKTSKLKELVQDKERALADKTHEHERAAKALAALRRDVRTREWQAVLSAKASVSPRKKARRVDDQDDESELEGELQTQLLRSADVAALRNQLVRAESDSMLLVKAVDVATRQDGDLPESLKAEVSRIALRLKKARD